MTSPEKELLNFVVRFYNASNFNLHGAVSVEVAHVKDAIETGIKKYLEEYGEDVRSHNASITTPDGQGVAGTDDVATVSQLQNQLAEIQRQLSQHSENQAGGTSEVPEPTKPAPFNSDVKPAPENDPSRSAVAPGLSLPAPAPSSPFSAADVAASSPE